MNIKKRTNNKFLAVSLLLSSVIVGLSAQKISAEETTPDTVNVEPVTSTVSTNMLNIHSAVITEVNVEKMEGKNQDIKVKFDSVPKVEEKIFAVLVDAIVGKVIQAQYLDSNNSVEFKDVMEYIKIPGIHLYKQSPDDKEFAIRSYNFIASTAYLLPYGRKINNNGGLTGNEVPACKSDGTKYEEAVPKATFYTTTVPQVYSLAIPKDFFTKIGASGVTAKNVLAAVISYADDDDKKIPEDVRQWVSSNYDETETNVCRFEFLLPENVNNVHIHLYKNGLYKDTFLCKFLVKINKQPATNYSLD